MGSQCNFAVCCNKHPNFPEQFLSSYRSNLNKNYLKLISGWRSDSSRSAANWAPSRALLRSRTCSRRAPRSWPRPVGLWSLIFGLWKVYWCKQIFERENWLVCNYSVRRLHWYFTFMLCMRKRSSAKLIGYICFVLFLSAVVSQLHSRRTSYSSIRLYHKLQQSSGSSVSHSVQQ